MERKSDTAALRRGCLDTLCSTQYVWAAGRLSWNDKRERCDCTGENWKGKSMHCPRLIRVRHFIVPSTCSARAATCVPVRGHVTEGASHHPEEGGWSYRHGLTSPAPSRHAFASLIMAAASAVKRAGPGAAFPSRVRSSALIILATLIVLRPGLLLGEGKDAWEKAAAQLAQWKREREESAKQRRKRDRMTPL